jgi:hypothetical protein
MKTLLACVLAALLFLGLGFTRVGTVDTVATDVLQRLHLKDSEARDCIWSSFSGRYLWVPNVSELKSIARGERAPLVRQIGDYAKAFARSEEFKKRYAEYRESHKPSPPAPPKSMDAMKKEARETMTKAIRETEENMKTMKADMKASMKPVLESFREQLKEVDNPKNPMYSKEVEEMYRQGYEQQKQVYADDLAAWEKKYPPSSDGMIRSWLEDFLVISSSVDFSAAVTDGGGGKKVFVKQEYEKKSNQWKMCYRAGKETVEAGRAYAAAWLKELGK